MTWKPKPKLPGDVPLFRDDADRNQAFDLMESNPAVEDLRCALRMSGARACRHLPYIANRNWTDDRVSFTFAHGPRRKTTIVLPQRGFIDCTIDWCPRHDAERNVDPWAKVEDLPSQCAIGCARIRRRGLLPAVWNSPLAWSTSKIVIGRRSVANCLASAGHRSGVRTIKNQSLSEGKIHVENRN